VADLASSFVRETIAALVHFHPTSLNEAWFEERYASWTRERAGKDVQLHEPADAEAYLEGFWSPDTGRLWDEAYAKAFMALLPDTEAKSVNVWNPGCGKGYETWSVACALKRRYPESRIKVWANDSDLLAISMAPNMVFPENIEDWYGEFMVKGRNGQSFNQQLKDSVFFEFHDVLNASPLPPLDLIVCRDLLSFLPPIDQNRLLNDFSDKLKPTGILVLGANENPGAGWAAIGTGALPAFRKE
jgi:purine-binding chemotaxis protein CheW